MQSHAQGQPIEPAKRDMVLRLPIVLPSKFLTTAVQQFKVSDSSALLHDPINIVQCTQDYRSSAVCFVRHQASFGAGCQLQHLLVTAHPQQRVCVCVHASILDEIASICRNTPYPCANPLTLNCIHMTNLYIIDNHCARLEHQNGVSALELSCQLLQQVPN